MALLLTNHHFFRARVLITLDGPRDADYKSISTQTLAVPQCKHCNFVAHQKNPNFKYQKRDEGKQLFFQQRVRTCSGSTVRGGEAMAHINQTHG